MKDSLGKKNRIGIVLICAAVLMVALIIVMIIVNNSTSRNSDGGAFTVDENTSGNQGAETVEEEKNDVGISGDTGDASSEEHEGESVTDELNGEIAANEDNNSDSAVYAGEGETEIIGLENPEAGESRSEDGDFSNSDEAGDGGLGVSDEIGDGGFDDSDEENGSSAGENSDGQINEYETERVPIY